MFGTFYILSLIFGKSLTLLEVNKYTDICRMIFLSLNAYNIVGRRRSIETRTQSFPLVLLPGIQYAIYLYMCGRLLSVNFYCSIAVNTEISGYQRFFSKPPPPQKKTQGSYIKKSDTDFYTDYFWVIKKKEF